MKKTILILNEKEMNEIFLMLGEIPLKYSGQVYGKLQSLLAAQSVEQVPANAGGDTVAS